MYSIPSSASLYHKWLNLTMENEDLNIHLCNNECLLCQVYARLVVGMCTRMKDSILVFRQRMEEEGREEEVTLGCII